MKDLIGKAHAYLDDKGCKSMGQQYTAFEVERMLADMKCQHYKYGKCNDPNEYVNKQGEGVCGRRLDAILVE